MAGFDMTSWLIDSDLYNRLTGQFYLRKSRERFVPGSRTTRLLGYRPQAL